MLVCCSVVKMAGLLQAFADAVLAPFAAPQKVQATLALSVAHAVVHSVHAVGSTDGRCCCLQPAQEELTPTSNLKDDWMCDHDLRSPPTLRSYIIEQARLLRQKTENRYLAVLVAAWGVNRCRKALFGVASRPDTPTAVLGGETVEH